MSPRNSKRKKVIFSGFGTSTISKGKLKCHGTPDRCDYHHPGQQKYLSSGLEAAPKKRFVSSLIKELREAGLASCLAFRLFYNYVWSTSVVQVARSYGIT
ncbi:MAG: hypothetical protein IPH75_16380 [bacterium]|nr:hypothetical protein [bacterium]